MRRRKASVPLEQRMKIAREFLTGNESAKVLGERYDVLPGTINMWVHRFKNKENSVSLPSEEQKGDSMSRTKKMDPSEENELLKKRIKELEASLHHEELKNLALNTMIDIAEEQGISIRKKSGAKQ